MEQKNVAVNKCIFFICLLQITFIILKLLGVINWYWALVLLPIIITAVIAVFWYMIILIVYILFH